MWIGIGNFYLVVALNGEGGVRRLGCQVRVTYLSLVVLLIVVVLILVVVMVIVVLVLVLVIILVSSSLATLLTSAVFTVGFRTRRC